MREYLPIEHYVAYCSYFHLVYISYVIESIIVESVYRLVSCDT